MHHDEPIEIEFICVPKEAAIEFLTEIYSLSVEKDQRPSPKDIRDDVELVNTTDELPDGRLLAGIKMGRHVLEDVLVKIEPAAESGIIIDISFMPRDWGADELDVMSELHAFATRLAGAYGATDFYAGFERASDEATQLFRGAMRAPLFYSGLE